MMVSVPSLQSASPDVYLAMELSDVVDTDQTCSQVHDNRC